MARVNRETLGDRELACVFVSPTLAEARQAEALLTERGVDYVVEAEPLGRTLFGSARYWAAFYVESGQAQYCGTALVAAGLEAGVVVGEDTDS